MSIEDPPRPRRNPRPIPPDQNPDLGGYLDPLSTLTSELGYVVDDIRQDIEVDLGLRPYRVFSIVTYWTGGQIGYGDPEEVSRVELVPRPRVTFETKLDAIKYQMLSGGKQDTGLVVVDRVSPNFTEDDINAIFHLQPLPEAHEGYLEIGMDERDGQAIKRRYVLSSPPWRDVRNFQWRLILRVQEQSFTRTGDPQPVHSPEEVDAASPENPGENWWQA